eukprot:403355047
MDTNMKMEFEEQKEQIDTSTHKQSNDPRSKPQVRPISNLIKNEEQTKIKSEADSRHQDHGNMKRESQSYSQQNTKPLHSENYGETHVINPSSGINFLDGKLNSTSEALLRQKLPNLRKRDNKKSQKQRDEEQQTHTSEETADLKQKMIRALLEDHEYIKSGECPAIERLKLLSRVDEQMRKKHIQREFLQQGGLQVLAEWISANPDETYPLAQVIELVFEVLENMPIESNHLENSSLPSVLSRYANNMCSYPHLANRALTIIQRWQAIVYKLNYKYDDEGYHEQKQRELREKIKMIGCRVDLGNAEEELIRRNANGQIMMYSSNFDFLEKPRPFVEPRQKKEKSSNAKDNIERAFTLMKKQKESTSGGYEVNLAYSRYYESYHDGPLEDQKTEFSGRY